MDIGKLSLDGEVNDAVAGEAESDACAPDLAAALDTQA
jgi:hypothetical protein